MVEAIQGIGAVAFVLVAFVVLCFLFTEAYLWVEKNIFWRR